MSDVDDTIGDKETRAHRPSDDKSSLADGTLLGDYRIIEELGRGGMGVVYLAEHIHLKKNYAVKVLPESLSGKPDFVDRFYTEGRVMADLKHDSIVQVHTMSVQGGVHYLIMELVETDAGRGVTLDDYLEENSGKLPPDEVADIVTQICSGLQYAHNYRNAEVKEGVVHRDLKPGNILLGRGGKVKIADFGLAKIIGAEFIMSSIHKSRSASVGSQPTQRHGNKGKYKKTTSGSILGTYDYMSPEQKNPLRADQVGHRTDIYSLGVMIYRMLTGEKPEGRFKLPSETDATIPKFWDVIIDVCLQPKPRNRYRNCTEIIQGIPTELPVEARVGIPEQPTFKKRITNSIGMELVYIEPTGDKGFMMGSSLPPKKVWKHFGGDAEWHEDERPLHKVILTKGFYFQTTEVTQRQWTAVMGANPSYFKGNDLPVEQVAWHDAQNFIKKLNEKEGTNKYRLPTEAEWEYSCRAGSTTVYYWGYAMNDKYCWSDDNSEGETHPVGRKKPNTWGLYDMSGNVWEWCEDRYEVDYYDSSPDKDPRGPRSGKFRVLRGGSWNYLPGNCRSAGRGGDYPGNSMNDLGFRIARAPD